MGEPSEAKGRQAAIIGEPTLSGVGGNVVVDPPLVNEYRRYQGDSRVPVINRVSGYRRGLSILRALMLPAPLIMTSMQKTSTFLRSSAASLSCSTIQRSDSVSGATERLP